MAISNITGSVSAGYNLKIIDDNYNRPSKVINKPVNENYSFGTGNDEVNLIFSEEFIIAPFAIQTLTLNDGSMKDIYGNNLDFTSIKSMRVQHAPESAATGNIILSGDYMTFAFVLQTGTFAQIMPRGSIYFMSKANTGYARGSSTEITLTSLTSQNATITVDIIGI